MSTKTPLKGFLNIDSAIAPNFAEDTYPIFDVTYGKGGYRSVLNKDEMLKIPDERKSIGMMTYVRDEDKLYILKQTSQDVTEWVVYVSGSIGNEIDCGIY